MNNHLHRAPSAQEKERKKTHTNTPSTPQYHSPTHNSLNGLEIIQLYQQHVYTYILTDYIGIIHSVYYNSTGYIRTVLI